MHVGQHPRECSALRPHLPICEYPVVRVPSVILLAERPFQYIVMAMHAHPVPVDPYNPSSAASASSRAQIIHPSPYVPIRLRVFAPVIFLNDCIVSVLGVCIRLRQGTRPRTFSQDRGAGASWRMEEGDGDGDNEQVELRPLPRAPPTLRQTAAGRRKLD